MRDVMPVFDEQVVAGTASEPSGKTGHRRSWSGRGVARPIHHGISEGVGSVKRRSSKRSTISGLIGPPEPRFLGARARVVNALERVAQGRAVKAGRRPPAGEALRARSFRFKTMVSEARQGFLRAPCPAGERVRWSSPVPHGW